MKVPPRPGAAPTSDGGPAGEHAVHTKALRDGVRELRVILGETSWRISYWLPSGRGRVIVLLTVFQKTREGPQHDDVERAVKAKQICEATHLDATTHLFGRSGS
ncbi:type II toxin-antitoxin system RelE/ParE family toxin [Microbispora rosea]|uniref:type II toxin-antitoxin system RelE/ParE family toxin n=1 Tax=Microbispora rosea TaxID=58117 RepID=UPI00378E3904